jgi:predicted aldo/keto reductase-like oxidoreductase
MKTVVLGQTGLRVSRVGIGGIPLTRPTEDETVKLVRHALDLGITFIDTAHAYGNSEERIGKAISGRREGVIIATKGRGQNRVTTLQHIAQSLKRLNTEYIDLWQFHGINTDAYYEQVLGPGGGMEGAREALRAGMVRHIGFSSHSLDVALKAVASGHFETVQVPFNFVCNEASDELVPLAREHDVGFIAMKPFAGGMLRDASLAIKYLLQFQNVVPDPGIEKAGEIEQIVDIVNGHGVLTPEERQEMEEVRARLGTRFCRRCEYCMPCPQGVHISGALHLQVLWGLWSPDWYFSWPYVDYVVQRARDCIQCGECEKKCPYSLPIREMLAENLAFYEAVAAEHNVS